ncbi:MAG TPA: RimK/LysX family protein [Thermoanaerobaculia bacterium]|nr:RimK/LysX family protein [Thermoanaerobaculia bacterium]
MEPGSPVQVGWKEYLDLPELGIFRLKAKVDTGARTSALHVSSFAIVETLPDGTEIAEVVVGTDRRRPGQMVTARVKILGHLRVTDSGGHPEVRPLVETEIVLGPVRKRIRITLTNRAGRLFRMILGRKALEGDFVVDTSRKYLLRRWHKRNRA